jgi:hypothetical protein
MPEAAKTENKPEVIASELASLPLESLIGGAIKAVVNGQAIAGTTTLNFIKALAEEKPLVFKTTTVENGVSSERSVSVPLLSVVQVPSLRIDSFTTHFNFELKTIDKTTLDKDLNGTLGASTSGLLSKFFSLDIKGGISNKSSSESSINRSGSLDITIHASEAPMPEGLAKVLSILSRSIDEAPQPANTTGGTAPNTPANDNN